MEICNLFLHLARVNHREVHWHGPFFDTTKWTIGGKCNTATLKPGCRGSLFIVWYVLCSISTTLQRVLLSLRSLDGGLVSYFQQCTRTAEHDLRSTYCSKSVYCFLKNIFHMRSSWYRHFLMFEIRNTLNRISLFSLKKWTENSLNWRNP